ncbi:MAG: hypothetical protein GY835_25160 [bacterium]|nr:hypothetical protein [bacterium]
MVVILAGLVSFALGSGAGWRVGDGDPADMQLYAIWAMILYTLIVVAMVLMRVGFDFRSVRILSDVLCASLWGLGAIMDAATWTCPDTIHPAECGIGAFGTCGLVFLLLGSFLLVTIYGLILKYPPIWCQALIKWRLSTQVKS